MIGLLMMLAAAAGADTDSRCAPPQIGQPARPVIEDEDTARQVAQVYLAKFYGADLIKAELPLRVSLRNGVWHVKGKAPRQIEVGGVAEIDLCQSSGQVLWLFHGE